MHILIAEELGVKGEDSVLLATLQPITAVGEMGSQLWKTARHPLLKARLSKCRRAGRQWSILRHRVRD